MAADGKFKLILVYRWNDRDIPVGDTNDPEVMALAKERILEAASAELDALRGLDPILQINAECQLRRKQKSLNLLIPHRRDRDWP